MYYLSIEWILSIIALIISITIFYLIVNVRKYDYWKKLGINGPKPLPIFGNLLSLRKQSHFIKLDWMRKYGKLYGTYYGTNPVLVIAKPELIKQILVKDFDSFRNKSRNSVSHPIWSLNIGNIRDEKWKRIRTIVSPTFTSGKLKSMYSTITNIVNDYLSKLEVYSVNGSNFNMKEIYFKFTGEVISKCAFGLSLNMDSKNDYSLLTNIESKSGHIILMSVLPKFMLRLLNIKGEFPTKPIDFTANAMKVIIKDRKENKTDNKDLLQLLINAEQSDEHLIAIFNDKNESHYINEGVEEIEAYKKELKFSKGNNKLSENEIIAQAILFFFAGHKGASHTLTFCSFELALNQQIQQTLYNEIKSAVDGDENLPYDVLMQLPYLDAVVCETMRKYPVSIVMRRETSTEYKLDGITLPKHQTIEINIYSVHHCEEYYPNPEKFIPERFLPENRHKIVPYSYLPFGLGPRNCVGMRFGLMEMKLCLAHTLLKYKLIKSDNSEHICFKNNFRVLTPDNTFILISNRD